MISCSSFKTIKPLLLIINHISKLNLSKTTRISFSSHLSFWMCVALVLFYSYSGIGNTLTSWDNFGYYFYLHLSFINKDLTFTNADFIRQIINEYNLSSSMYQFFVVEETGNWVIRYPCGMALLYSPFFLLGHIGANVFDFKQDAISLPYQYAMSICSLFYSVLGIWYLRKVLKLFFSDNVTAITMIVVVCFTNAIAYLSNTITPHNLLFAINICFVHYAIKWCENATFKNSITIGFLLGLTTLSRHTELIIILLPIFYNVYDKKSLIEKWKFVKANKYKLLVSIISFVIVFIPQIYYWKTVTGHFLFDGYSNNPAEGLDLLSPYTFNYLFSFRKGWFVYTPIMLFAMFGLLVVYKQNKKIFLPLFLYSFFTIYVLSSWTNWWYTNSFGQRSIVQCYGVFAILIACFFVFISSKKLLLKLTVTIVTITLGLLNHFQFWQLNAGVLPSDLVTAKYYKAIFLKTNLTGEEKRFLLKNKGDLPDLTSNPNKYFLYKSFYAKTQEEKLFDKVEFNNVNVSTFVKNAIIDDYVIFRCKFKIKPAIPNQNGYILIPLHYNYNKKPYCYKGQNVDFSKLSYNEWTEVKIDYTSTDVRTFNDEIVTYVWNIAHLQFYIKDFVLESHVPIIKY